MTSLSICLADDELPYNRIVFAHGYYASGMHEISHWCVAGAERRKLVDFGYWYCPDGRDAETQGKFEDVEVKPPGAGVDAQHRRQASRLTSAATT